jgi:hypothetical protein
VVVNTNEFSFITAAAEECPIMTYVPEQCFLFTCDAEKFNIYILLPLLRKSVRLFHFLQKSVQSVFSFHLQKNVLLVPVSPSA